MAEQELFFIKPTAKVQASSESRGFYDEIVNGKGIFSTKYQLYRIVFAVADVANNSSFFNHLHRLIKDCR